MINTLGKTLVAFNLALSMVFLVIALGLFTNPVDWGWKEPRQELGERIPSEIDKRTAAVKVFLRHREQVETAVAQAQKELTVNEENWTAYHLEYARLLDELRNKPGDISVKAIKRNAKGELAFAPTQPGKVILEADVIYTPKDGAGPVPVNKSFKTYHEMLGKVQKDLEDLTGEIKTEAVKLEEKTKLLDGDYDPKDKDKEKLVPGIYDLLENEKQLQRQIKKAIENIRPLWVRNSVEAQLLVNRRNALQARLDELKDVAPEKEP